MNSMVADEKGEMIAKQKAFVDHLFVKEIGRMQREGFTFFSFVLMGQAIETLGAFLDKKPMKATGQSAKRFSKGLNWLMGDRYKAINKDHWFFLKFRNQLTHSFVPSRELILISESELEEGMHHLGLYEGRRVLVAERMYEDLCKGCKKLYGMLDQGRVAPTRVGEIKLS
ncbi:hypothetical protein K5X82_07820 [Halosquirtibacter xylanolyticus]|uniref:hypothetical protein n=1 Tax=Halosquirtibacter xylanolyticus TaxID=3374599 RepID=UPI0037488B0A|nr:hypothetical protein K5X82_07820 [Prolixibacteraceae bacterium]